MVYYIFTEAKEMCEEGLRDYFASGWNIVDIINLAMFVAVFIVQVSVPTLK